MKFNRLWQEAFSRDRAVLETVQELRETPLWGPAECCAIVRAGRLMEGARGRLDAACAGVLKRHPTRHRPCLCPNCAAVNPVLSAIAAMFGGGVVFSFGTMPGFPHPEPPKPPDGEADAE